MSYDEEDKFATYIGKRFQEGTEVASNILNAQRYSNDQPAPPQRMSPYVGLSFYTSEVIDGWEKELKRVTKSLIPRLLERIGKKKPRQKFLVFENENFYLDKYNDVVKIYENNPNKYKSIIEDEMSKSDIYPYRGQLRPNFRMEGLMSEIEWAVDALLREEFECDKLIALYLHHLNYKIPDQYPHE